MKKTQGGEWARDKQQLRYSLREARWCLADGSRVKLPVLGGAKATDLAYELAGGHPALFAWEPWMPDYRFWHSMLNFIIMRFGEKVVGMSIHLCLGIVRGSFRSPCKRNHPFSSHGCAVLIVRGRDFMAAGVCICSSQALCLMLQDLCLRTCVSSAGLLHTKTHLSQEDRHSSAAKCHLGMQDDLEGTCWPPDPSIRDSFWQ